MKLKDFIDENGKLNEGNLWNYCLNFLIEKSEENRKRNFNENALNEQKNEPKIKDFENNLSGLWNYCLKFILSQKEANFSEVSIKNFKQKEITNIDKLDYGLCGITAIYSSFHEYLNLSLKNVNSIVKNMGRNVKNTDLLVNHINENYCKGKIKLEAKRFFNNESLSNKIEKILKNNISPVFVFAADELKSSGHAVSIYKLTDGILGFIENAQEKVFIELIALFNICTYLQKIKSPDCNLTISELYNARQNLFQNFYKKYVNFVDECKTEFNIKFLPETDSIIKGLIYLVAK